MNENYGKTNSCLLGTKAPTRLNIELKHYGRELYEAFADLTAQNMELLLHLPVRTFSVYTSFPVRFLNISALGDWMKFPYFTQCLHLWGFVENIAL